MSLPDVPMPCLITRARLGNRAAFDAIYAADERKVYGFIRARTSQDADARQVAQSTRLTSQCHLPRVLTAPRLAAERGWAGVSAPCRTNTTG